MREHLAAGGDPFDVVIFDLPDATKAAPAPPPHPGRNPRPLRTCMVSGAPTLNPSSRRRLGSTSWSTFSSRKVLWGGTVCLLHPTTLSMCAPEPRMSSSYAEPEPETRRLLHPRRRKCKPPLPSRLLLLPNSPPVPHSRPPRKPLTAPHYPLSLDKVCTATEQLDTGYPPAPCKYVAWLHSTLEKATRPLS